MNEGLRKRIVTAVVLAAMLIAIVLLLPPVATLVLLTVLVLAGAWEWSAFLRAPGVVTRAAYVAFLAVMMPVIWHVTETAEGRQIVLATAVAWWLVALAWVVFAPHRVSSWAAALAGLLALLPAWVALLRLRCDLAHGADPLRARGRAREAAGVTAADPPSRGAQGRAGGSSDAATKRAPRVDGRQRDELRTGGVAAEPRAHAAAAFKRPQYARRAGAASASDQECGLNCV